MGILCECTLFACRLSVHNIKLVYVCLCKDEPSTESCCLAVNWNIFQNADDLHISFASRLLQLHSGWNLKALTKPLYPHARTRTDMHHLQKRTHTHTHTHTNIVIPCLRRKQLNKEHIILINIKYIAVMKWYNNYKPTTKRFASIVEVNQ